MVERESREMNVKKLLEKADEEAFVKDANVQVGQAKKAEQSGKFFKFLYTIWDGVSNGNTQFKYDVHVHIPN